MEHFEVWLDMDYIYVRNAQGNVASKPIARYERLHKASEEQRKDFELSLIFSLTGEFLSFP